MIISNFSNKKVCQYLDEGKYHKVLIKFFHGLGDAVMFYNTCYKALQKRYPCIEFFYATHLGQEDIFGKVDNNPDNYDIAFDLAYPCSEWGSINETKSEKCARLELGLPLPLEESYSFLRQFPSPLVGVHFNSTCCPGMNVPENIGKMLWEQILEAGLIPIDTHMRHTNDHKDKSIVYNYEQCRRIDNVNANAVNLIGLLSTLRGFAGVPSGNMPCALSVLPPHKILYLSSQFPKDRLTHVKCFEMNIKKPYDRNLVSEWLSAVKEI